MTEAALLELRLLRAENAELREDVAYALRALLAEVDRRTGAALVPLIAGVFGGEPFTAAELAAHALNARDAEGQALRELVGQYATDEGGLRAFGKLLGRLEGVTFDGCRLKPAGEARGVQRWRVRVSGA